MNKQNTDTGITNSSTAYSGPNLEWMPLPALLVTEDRITLAWNGDFQRLFPVAEKSSDVAGMIRDPDFLATLKSTIKTGQAGECQISIKGQTDHFFTVWIKALDHKATEDNRLYIIHLKETTKEHEAERMRSTFVADVSHELRSPLTTMIATLETLQGPAGTDTATRERFLSITADEAHRMHRIVNDLLALSATEAREHIRPNQQVNLNAVIGNIIQTLAERLANKNMTVKTHLANNLPTITGEHDELIKVFQNLLDNAIQYGDEGSIITVTLNSDTGGDEQRVEINNFGNTISPKHIPRLTERFYRADSSRSRALGGTGLGLAIVKHILGRHSTSLRVKSTDVDGTTFSVTLSK